MSLYAVAKTHWLWYRLKSEQLIKTLEFLRLASTLDNLRIDNSLFGNSLFKVGTYETKLRKYGRQHALGSLPVPHGFQHQSLSLFIDGNFETFVPCDITMTDREFLTLLSAFYYIQKYRRGTLEAIGFKTLSHVEIVELKRAETVDSEAQKAILGLGRYKLRREIYYLRHLNRLHRHQLVAELIEHGVISSDDASRRVGLNFVSTWHATYTFCAAVSPAILGILACVVWPIVAVKVYDADVQTSVQTGSAVSSNIVTTVGYVVALLAFAAPLYERMQQNTNSDKVIKVEPGSWRDERPSEDEIVAARPDQPDNEPAVTAASADGIALQDSARAGDAAASEQAQTWRTVPRFRDVINVARPIRRPYTWDVERQAGEPGAHSSGAS